MPDLVQFSKQQAKFEYLNQSKWEIEIHLILYVLGKNPGSDLTCKRKKDSGLLG